MASAERRWRGKTRDQRQAERRAQILDAATDIVACDGAAALTTRAVARRTGLIQRYIYESFNSRDELLRTVFDAQLARVLSSLQVAYTEAQADDVLDKMATAFRATVLELMQSDPRIIRILAVEASADPALKDRAGVLFSSLEQLVVDVVLAQRDSELTSIQQTFLAKSLVGGALTVFRAWVDGTLPLTPEELVDTAVSSLRRAPWSDRG